MKIKSNFRDYYDWCTEIDQSPTDVVYNRVDLTPSPDENDLVLESIFTPHHCSDLLWYCKDYKEYKGAVEIKGIVVSDCFYKCIRYKDSEKWKVLKHFEGDHILELSRKVGQPLFSIRGTRHTLKGRLRINQVVIDKKIPILEKFGLPAYVTPEEMANKIDYFVRNLKFEVPDQTPVSAMTDKEKLIAHGFNDPQSFRHRK